MQGAGRGLETTLACAMKMSSYYKRQEKKIHIKKKNHLPSLPFGPWEGEMLIFQLTDGFPGTTS